MSEQQPSEPEPQEAIPQHDPDDVEAAQDPAPAPWEAEN